ncbi:MAG: ligase-associated DNA damage response endonuclease PdeM [Alphaproteobacteria bacterium]
MTHAMTIAGLRVGLRPSGALWVEDERALVVADLHLEKGSAYAARGQLLPPWDTRETLDRLGQEIEATNPRMVILLGDTLHDGRAGTRIGIEEVALISAIAARRTLVWVVGNHDAEGPQGLPGETAADIAFGGLVLRHEPRAGADHGWAAGHLHPCARVRALGGSTRRRCFVTDGVRIVLPAFGAYAGGLNVRDVAYHGLFDGEPLAVVLGRGRSWPVGWTSLVSD